nr:unnamed protein product [Leishmania braziliensis]
MNRLRLRRSSPAQREPYPTVSDLIDRHQDANRHRKRWASACGRGCVALLYIFLFIVAVAGFVGYIVSRSPKELGEQWEDVCSYAMWWWSTMRGATSPCTYAGVRPYS